jgi:hypothetical protein
MERQVTFLWSLEGWRKRPSGMIRTDDLEWFLRQRDFFIMSEGNKKKIPCQFFPFKPVIPI